jgi:NAD(P)-dependent dehydrogenase (short-subunit alcohol dehydrogenase family)
MDGLLHGKTALVTGASRGIGRGVAERFAASGALVAVHYATNVAAAEETIAAIHAQGGEAFAIQAEFGASGAIEKVAGELETELLRRTGDDGLDILVNNAGGGEYASVQETSERLYDQAFALNTRTPFFLTQALLPRLRRGGSVINLSSEAARLHLVETVAYSMAKSALEDFTICLAKEVGARGIRVNAVRPGVIRTAQSEDYLSIPERKAEIENATALRRIGHTDDMAEFVHALVTAAGFVTGQIVEVSGGYLL